MTISVNDSLQYAHDVKSGKIPACRLVKQAVKRYFDDVKNARKKGFFFDEARAQDALSFYDHVPHVKGDRAGEKIALSPWQGFIVANIFGWLWTKTGKRRFKTVYIEVARKNGKSTLVAPLGVYMMAYDGEAGAEVYSAATSRDQARIVFDTARDMVRNSELRDSVKALNHSVCHESRCSFFKPLAADSDTLEGKNTHCAIIDELHAHKNRRVYDVLELSLAARSQPLLLVITTAGNDQTGICYEVRGYLTKILDGVIDDETVFGLVYTVDEPDKWTDERQWIQANPNLGVSVKHDDMRRLCRKAQQTPSAASEFKRKRLDIWCEGESAFFNMDRWNACPRIADDDHLRTLPAYFGLDLSSKVDVTALVALFVDENRRFHLKGRFFLPEAVLDRDTSGKPHHVQKLYHDWAKNGWLTLTPGSIIDYRIIRDAIMDWADVYDPDELAFDPWGATQLASELQEDEGMNMVSVQQSVKNFSEAMKETDALVIAGQLHHEHNPMLGWMFSNVTARSDKNDNVFPNKERPENKIDGAVASFLAMNRALVNHNYESVYDDEDLLVL